MENKKKFLRPIKTKSVVQQVIDRLTLAMINKELRPGDKIPTEKELSEMFGTARNSVREAVRVLVSFGVLEIRRPEGTFVAKGFSDPMIDPLLYGIILDDTGTMESLLELREWIDIATMRLAIEKATEEDVKLLEDCLADMEDQFKLNDFNGVFETDDIFHETLSEITHNTLFVKICHITRLLTTEIRVKTIQHMMRTSAGRKELYQSHVEEFNAVKNRDDVQAEALIRKSYFYDKGALEG